MIRSFQNDETERVFKGEHVPGLPPEIQERGRERLRQVDEAVELDDLRTPPGNRLEQLRGDRAGQWSIRINRQWRVCFEWDEANACEVEIVDYH